MSKIKFAVFFVLFGAIPAFCNENSKFDEIYNRLEERIDKYIASEKPFVDRGLLKKATPLYHHYNQAIFSDEFCQIASLGIKSLPEIYAKYFSDQNCFLIALIQCVARTNLSYFVHNKLLDQPAPGLASWWEGGQKAAKERFLQVMERQEILDREIFYNGARFLGIPSLPYLFLRIKEKNTILIPVAIDIIHYTPEIQRTRRILKLDKLKFIESEFSFDQCVAKWHGNYGEYDIKLTESWPIPTSDECWRWWKENWQDWLIPFPDQNYDAIEAEIIAADSTYIPLAQRMPSGTKQD